MYRRGGSKKDKNNKPAKEESDSSKYAELLVFGYACKLFRDDERAHFHEQDKHLIPWMGDKNIMIDRSVEQTHMDTYLTNFAFRRDLLDFLCTRRGSSVAKIVASLLTLAQSVPKRQRDCVHIYVS